MKTARITFSFLIAFLIAQAVFAADSPLIHLWEADSQTRGGRTVSCYIQLSAATESRLVSANLSLFAEPVGADKIQIFTGLKLRAARYGNGQRDLPIKIYGGWVRSSSASTVGRLKSVDTEKESYFLGAASGMELFTSVLDGVVKDGMSVGYQERPGTFDKVIRVPEPLPPEAFRKFLSCLTDLKQSINQ